MSQAVAGHGATIAVEQNPTVAPGVFTTIAELNGDIQEPGLMRPETETTPHQDTIDSYIMGRLGRDAVTFTINYIYSDASHADLVSKIQSNEFFGVRFRGPGWTVEGQDEIIGSGFVQAISITDPVREGARTAEVTIRLSKRMKINGTFVGQAA